MPAKEPSISIGHLKRRNSLGDPPAEASSNLSAPEIAPADSTVSLHVVEQQPAAAAVVMDAPTNKAARPAKVRGPKVERKRSVVRTLLAEIREERELADEANGDGRGLRRSAGRHVQLSTHVTASCDRELRELAARERLTLAEVIEVGLLAIRRLEPGAE